MPNGLVNRCVCFAIVLNFPLHSKNHTGTAVDTKCEYAFKVRLESAAFVSFSGWRELVRL